MKKTSFILDTRIYPLDTVYAAGYVMMDDAYVLLEEPDKEDEEYKVRINIISKSNKKDKARDKSENEDQIDMKERFYEELLNYAVYKIVSERNEKIRQTIIQRLLLTNGFEVKEKNDQDR